MRLLVVLGHLDSAAGQSEAQKWARDLEGQRSSPLPGLPPCLPSKPEGGFIKTKSILAL